MAVFCDWLDVTFSPADTPLCLLEGFLLDLGAIVRGDGAYGVGPGVLKVDRRARFLRVSASGSALAYMRDAGAFLAYLDILASAPHRVTRLDAALDVPRDGPDVLSELHSRYPDGQVSLGRKSLSVRRFLDVRPDGRETGTYYVGHRSAARATARVYDKAWERLQKAGESGPPRTRYEVTVRKDYGATLRDAAEPRRLFWHVASPALLEQPGDVEPWDSGWGGGWRAVDLPDPLPADILGRRVESSPELDLLAGIADRMGPEGRVWLARRLLARLGVECPSALRRSSAASLGSPEGA